MTVSQIARENNCSHSTIIKYLRTFDVQREDRKNSLNIKGKLAYGSKVLNDRVVDDKNEQAIIRKMLLLHVSGNSYRKIAEVLNENKVPTKTYSKKWDPKTVFQILCRHKRLSKIKAL